MAKQKAQAQKAAPKIEAPVEQIPDETVQESIAPPERPVVFKTIECQFSWDDDGTERRSGGVGAITAEEAAEILGMETEEQFKDAYMAAKISAGECEGWTEQQIADERELVSFGENFMFRLGKQKVQCWNSIDNRKFDLAWAKSIAHDILTRKARLNGESVIIGETGKVLSANHRLAGLLIADWEWEFGSNKDIWQSIWEGRPTWESLVIRGIPEDFETVTTLDNTKPRSGTDVIQTSRMFQLDDDGHPIGFSDQRLCSDMMSSCVDFLWRRTRAGNELGNRYKTNSRIMEFVNRHPRLKQCVMHLFTENKALKGEGDNKKTGRKISNLFRSPGRCAGAMYLMACSESDGDAYRGNSSEAHGKDRPILFERSEETLEFTRMDLARKFWTEIGKGEGSALVKVLRQVRRPAEGQTSEDELDRGYVFTIVKGVDVSEKEKMTAIALAWRQFILKKGNANNIKPEDCSMTDLYYRNYDEDILNEDGSHPIATFGLYQEIDLPDFGGIDMGDPKEEPKKAKAVVQEEEGTREMTDEEIAESDEEIADQEVVQAAKNGDPKAKHEKESKNAHATRIRREMEAQEAAKVKEGVTGKTPTGPKKAGQPIARKPGNG